MLGGYLKLTLCNFFARSSKIQKPYLTEDINLMVKMDYSGGKRILQINIQEVLSVFKEILEFWVLQTEKQFFENYMFDLCFW